MPLHYSVMVVKTTHECRKKISRIRSYLEELGFLTKLLYVGLVSTNLQKKTATN